MLSESSADFQLTNEKRSSEGRLYTMLCIIEVDKDNPLKQLSSSA